MAREIIHVQVGQCGNQIGYSFWSNIKQEHLINENGTFEGKLDTNKDNMRLDKIDAYYKEISPYKFIPRACLIDLEPSIIDNIQASPIGKSFKPDNICVGSSDTTNNWFVFIYL